MWMSKNLLVIKDPSLQINLTKLSNIELDHVMLLFIKSIKKVHSICAQHYECNESTEENSQLLFILPNDNIYICHSQFCGITRKHLDWLKASWMAVEIDTLQQQHQQLVHEIRQKSVVKKGTNACDGKVPFLKGIEQLF